MEDLVSLFKQIAHSSSYRLEVGEGVVNRMRGCCPKGISPRVAGYTYESEEVIWERLGKDYTIRPISRCYLQSKNRLGVRKARVIDVGHHEYFMSMVNGFALFVNRHL